VPRGARGDILPNIHAQHDQERGALPFRRSLHRIRASGAREPEAPVWRGEGSIMMNASSNPLVAIPTIVGVGLVCLAIPSFNLTTIDFLLGFAIYAGLAISWNWVCGLGGLMNMAHIAFYAIGAYSCSIAVAKLGL